MLNRIEFFNALRTPPCLLFSSPPTHSLLLSRRPLRWPLEVCACSKLSFQLKNPRSTQLPHRQTQPTTLHSFLDAVFHPHDVCAARLSKLNVVAKPIPHTPSHLSIRSRCRGAAYSLTQLRRAARSRSSRFVVFHPIHRTANRIIDCAITVRCNSPR